MSMPSQRLMKYVQYSRNMTFFLSFLSKFSDGRARFQKVVVVEPIVTFHEIGNLVRTPDIRMAVAGILVSSIRFAKADQYWRYDSRSC